MRATHTATFGLLPLIAGAQRPERSLKGEDLCRSPRQALR
jgi:hypothetical protein